MAVAATVPRGAVRGGKADLSDAVTVFNAEFERARLVPDAGDVLLSPKARVASIEQRRGGAARERGAGSRRRDSMR